MNTVIEKCYECGKREECYWNEETNKTLIKYQLCFNCNFWREKVLMKDKPKVVRIKGSHYTIGAEEAPTGMFRGFGGRVFKILFDDGREVTTTNLWHQGIIPEHFKERLPDNAKFLTEEYKGSTYV